MHDAASVPEGRKATKKDGETPIAANENMPDLTNLLSWFCG